MQCYLLYFHTALQQFVDFKYLDYMKSYFLFISFLLIFSCREEFEFPPICEHRSATVETSIEHIYQYRIVNFIAPDSNHLTSLWFELGIKKDSFFVYDQLPNTYTLKVFDKNDNFLFEETEYDFDIVCEAYLLWDGFLNDKFYEGEFLYELHLGFEDDEFFNLETTCLAVSCEDYLYCHEEWGDECQYQNCDESEVQLTDHGLAPGML